MFNFHVLPFVTVVGLCQVVTGSYVNNFDQRVEFKCTKDTQTISRVHSVHDNGAEDRRFEFECREIGMDTEGTSASCAWSANYENQLDKPLDFECGHNGFINGMISEHDNGAEDRRWKFRCCRITDIHMIDCDLTTWTNDFDKPQDYRLPSGMAMKSVFSEHDNGAEDRRYRYEICNILRSSYLVYFCTGLDHGSISECLDDNESLVMTMTHCLFCIHVLPLVTVVGLCQLAAGNYVNDFDQPVNFKCTKDTQTISRVHSVHDNGAEDRRFEFECRDIGHETDGSSASCAWSANYENQLDQPLDFVCHLNGFINGMISIHDNGAEDRRWKFLCCKIPDIHMEDCDLTTWTNDLDKPQDYTLPSGKAMKGVFSEHDNGAEDRRYRYEICNIVRSSTDPAIG
ncbi:uncharacterized protein LOC123543887 [Mercenaria mercenaria]|uniref:uncharacterized protein LOC123543887 n=1 Tax=Mercenaria mercenaria TaxID=6596 RepID=UPI00234F2D1A|nr:uncharacterized protein LOC123543887 [Mercenaria mercenaria]